jgi:hypothetical protein
MRAFLLLALVPQLVAQCPNGCSGHGTCGAGNVCTCDPTYSFAADCSMGELLCSFAAVVAPPCPERLPVPAAVNCPTGIAWWDKASVANTAHASETECSNQGTCLRTTGQCTCLAGFTGRACSRRKCARTIWCYYCAPRPPSQPASQSNDFVRLAEACPNACSGHGECLTIGNFAEYDGPDVLESGSAMAAGDGAGPTYSNWDKDASSGCKCDNGFFGPDCSLGE